MTTQRLCGTMGRERGANAVQFGHNRKHATRNSDRTEKIREKRLGKRPKTRGIRLGVNRFGAEEIWTIGVC